MGSTIAVYDRLQQAGERAETIAALMRAALRTWDREDTPVERLLDRHDAARKAGG